ncbi:MULTISPECIES: NO-inducible flavohemoprotein [Acidobacteriaceae]|uniref:NO-inducible flavohemoprotein n=1 Tax=Acidobacteriaceae TaxID=204434 RepID=UPI00131E5BDA|nr:MULTISPECIES: NO-inducible flavohemoprotein [Acidobacteriaceae]MDW5265835.1 NO-inducible flavohemoprotein [Edaphobacter sp.]
MLQQQKEIVQATVPVLQQHGETITTEFYRTLFDENPSLFDIFNPANQQNGGQARSLAASILAYAAHIDKLDKLGGMVNRITHKHASLEVQPEHYPIVGDHLLRAIRTVLGEAATPAVIDAWGAAYGQLAKIMIGEEQKLYTEGQQQPGGWAGYAPLKVERKVVESETITSFHLVSPTGASLPPFQPGQYLGVKAHVPDSAFTQIRQYSLSKIADGRTYRISVKRETAPAHIAAAENGLISNHLHESVHEGDTILAHVPQGDFVLRDNSKPVVLLSGGVGITPAICMFEHLARNSNSRPVLFVHATTQRRHHAFRDEVRALAAAHPHTRALVYYEKVSPADVQGCDFDVEGRLTVDSLRPYLFEQATDFYYCGPVGFMAAVERILDELNVLLADRYSEAFAPDPSFVTELANA